MQAYNRVFISSFSRENPLPADDKLSCLREALWNLDRERVWVAEFSAKPLSELALTDPLAVADHLVELLKTSMCVVVILAGARHESFQTGTALNIGGQTVATSHFEIELLTAAVSNKPIHLFKLKGFDPGSRLKSLLECLRFAYPGWSSPSEQTEGKIKTAVEAILQNHAARQKAMERGGLAQMVRGFFLERGQSALTGGTEIDFLDGAIEVRGDEVNIAAVEQALTGGTGFVDGSISSDIPLDVQQKLSRAWIALRELMACSFNPEDSENRSHYRPDLLPLWDCALSAWSGAAAWSSLHGHIYLGPVAALTAMARAREAARGERKVRLAMDSNSLLHPYGGYASAWYSIAQRLPWGAKRKAYLHALWNANQGLTDVPNDPGLLAVRGSIELRLVRPWQAVADYEKAWKFHPKGYVECPETGQLMVELAVGCLFTGRWIRARQIADRGLAQMRRLQTEDGFLARALRKCALIHKLTGSLHRARDLEVEARQVALEGKIFDQARSARLSAHR